MTILPSLTLPPLENTTKMINLRLRFQTVFLKTTKIHAYNLKSKNDCLILFGRIERKV